MNGNSFVADTNILLYFIGGREETKTIIDYNIFISEITEIEMLGSKDLTSFQYLQRCRVIDNCALINMSLKIKKMTIDLKQTYNIKIPDAIIASTALFLNIPLITADKGFKKIGELDLQLLELK